MNQSAVFNSFRPSDPEIRKHIAYYYIHRSDSKDFSTQFTYYPHYRNGLTIYIDSDITFNERSSQALPSTQKSSTVLFSRNYDRAIQVKLKGPMYKLGMAFEPLGLNHFIDKPFNELAPNTVNRFDYFGTGFTDLARSILENPLSNPTSELDSFMRSQLKPFENTSIQRAVKLLLESSGEHQMQDLASELDINRKTLLRHFQKALSTSPKGYQKLIRFRNALNNYNESTQAQTFTELALEHAYYDQPAFIKHFKQITGLSPRKFFKRIQQFGTADTYWAVD